MKWRPADPEDRWVAVLWAVCAVSVIVLRPLWIVAAGVLVPCPWREWTGWPCPGCGTTRAMLHLLESDVVGALAWNPLATLGAVIFVAGGLAAPVWLACGGRAPSLALRLRPIWSAVMAALFLANWTWLALAGV